MESCAYFSPLACLLFDYFYAIDCSYTAGDTNVVAWDAYAVMPSLYYDFMMIHLRRRYPLLTVAMEGNIMLLRFLLNSGANIETKSDMGNTAMLYAAQVTSVRLLATFTM